MLGLFYNDGRTTKYFDNKIRSGLIKDDPDPVVQRYILKVLEVQRREIKNRDIAVRAEVRE